MTSGLDYLSDADDEPLEDLDLKYLQDPTDEDFKVPSKGGLIGNRYYSAAERLCTAGCGRRAVISSEPKGLRKRKTCGDPDCIHKTIVEANRGRPRRAKGNCSRAHFGTRLPEGTPFREQSITEEEITRIIDEGDQKTWRM